MTLVVIGKVTVQVVRDDEIEDSVAEKLESLVVAERDQVERGGASAKRLGEETHVSELDADEVFESVHVLQDRSRLD